MQVAKIRLFDPTENAGVLHERSIQNRAAAPPGSSN